MKGTEDRPQPGPERKREEPTSGVSREPGPAGPAEGAPQEPEPGRREAPLFRVRAAHPEELDESGAH